MPTPLCAGCYLQSFCRRLTSRVVADEELTPRFVADVRAFMRALQLKRDQWKPFLLDAYRDYPGLIVEGDNHDEEVLLDTSVFDLSSISYWFRDLCRPIPTGVMPRLRRDARARFRVTATILRAIYPVAGMLWGKVIANDEAILPLVVRQGECPYPHFAYHWSPGQT